MPKQIINAATRMKPAARHSWLLGYMLEQQRLTGVRFYANVLDAALVDAYIDATGASWAPSKFGAFKCPQLGRDLATLFYAQSVERSASGLPAGDASMGFPKWTYLYHL